MHLRGYKKLVASYPSPIHPPARDAARPLQFLTGGPQFCRRSRTIPSPTKYPATRFRSPFLSLALAPLPDPFSLFLSQGIEQPFTAEAHLRTACLQLPVALAARPIRARRPCSHLLREALHTVHDLSNARDHRSSPEINSQCASLADLVETLASPVRLLSLSQ
jgi:hypothetical protein